MVSLIGSEAIAVFFSLATQLNEPSIFSLTSVIIIILPLRIIHGWSSMMEPFRITLRELRLDLFPPARVSWECAFSALNCSLGLSAFVSNGSNTKSSSSSGKEFSQLDLSGRLSLTSEVPNSRASRNHFTATVERGTMHLKLAFWFGRRIACWLSVPLLSSPEYSIRTSTRKAWKSTSSELMNVFEKHLVFFFVKIKNLKKRLRLLLISIFSHQSKVEL